MTNPGWNISRPRPAKPFIARIFWTGLLALALLGAISMAKAHAICFDVQMKGLAMRCAAELARDDFLHHCGSRGQRAENVAYGYDTKAKTIAQWWRSPGHAANMRLPKLL